jgi:glutaredoxin
MPVLRSLVLSSLSLLTATTTAMSATAGPFLTLYTLPTCPHCVHTKAHLQELGVPFQAIELAPDIRDTVLKLAGRSSVPQGFISDVAPGQAAPPAEGWSLHHIKEGGEGIRALFPPETSVADALAKGLASEAVTSLPTADLSPLELVSKALPPPPPSQVLKPYTDLLSSLPAPAASLSPFSINTFYPPSTLPKPPSSPVAALHALRLLIPPAPIDGESPELKSYLDLYERAVSLL